MITAILALFAIAAPADDAAKKDLEKMQGNWAAASFIRDGRKFPDDDAQVMFRTVKGNEYTVYRFKEVIGKGRFKLDAGKTPKTIDFQPAPRAGQPETANAKMLGIYEFDGDKLKICIALPGRDPPTEFVSKPGTGVTITVWEREK